VVFTRRALAKRSAGHRVAFRQKIKVDWAVVDLVEQDESIAPEAGRSQADLAKLFMRIEPSRWWVGLLGCGRRPDVEIASLVSG
jgi:predicted nucleic acid-binding protein